MGGIGFTMRVNNNERNIPTDQVAAIEFGGFGTLTPEVRRRLTANQPFIVLRSGEVIDGRLYDLGGSSPLRVSIETSSGRRDFTSAEVGQVYLSNFEGSGTGTTNAAASAGAGGSGSVTVPGNQEWVSTNIHVNSGDRLTVNASGQVKYGPNREHQASVAGQRQHRGENAPLPSAPLGALIGRIDDGQPFLIGGNRTVTAPATGTLYLRVNDDIVADNSGAFQVSINTAGAGGARPRR
jgi:hypothetical protein